MTFSIHSFPLIDGGLCTFSKGIMWIYKISYVWYSMIGCFLVVIIGLVVSVLTGESEHFVQVTRGRAK